jgi:hypothetical protein
MTKEKHLIWHDRMKAFCESLNEGEPNLFSKMIIESEKH